MSNISIKSALISVFDKSDLEGIIRRLSDQNIKIYSTGGTEKFIRSLSVAVTAVESVTDYPSIFNGRVKTLHPKIFGGILFERNNKTHNEEVEHYKIPPVDLVVVDLYPFEETVKKELPHYEIIEKIDIGGTSLIRAAAKNFNDVIIIPSKDDYNKLEEILDNGFSTMEERRSLAAKAFAISSHYDSVIYKYFSQGSENQLLRLSENAINPLRYGENPHQKGYYYGDLNEVFQKLNGKDLSFNNLMDINAGIQLLKEFEDENVFIIIKHNNACGVAVGDTCIEAYNKALEADNVSAFGGIFCTNTTVNLEAAKQISSIFYEILIAPSFTKEALDLLKKLKNRIILKSKNLDSLNNEIKSVFNGYLVQTTDSKTDHRNDLQYVTYQKPGNEQIDDLLFASKIAKHSKSNTIVLAKNKQLLANGVGQTSRVDALNQAIDKAGRFNMDLNESVMASDAFFPFSDCVEIAKTHGINSIIQPGGSKNDQLSVDYCNDHGLSMVFTGFRHFKH